MHYFKFVSFAYMIWSDLIWTPDPDSEAELVLQIVYLWPVVDSPSGGARYCKL